MNAQAPELPESPAPVWPAVAMVAGLDIGLQRANNEDAVRIEPNASPWPLAVLADGMGGYSAGEVASGMAVQWIGDALCTGAADAADRAAWPEQARHELSDALQGANTAIYHAASATPAYRGMGTTVVAALVLPQELLVAHVGDSRAYAWRPGALDGGSGAASDQQATLTRITRDHSVVQEDIDAGLISEAEARASGMGHWLTRALGVSLAVEPEISHWPLQRGDRILLCSDGLTDMLDDQQLKALFAERPPLPQLLQRMMAAANAAGGKDNISVVLMEAQAVASS